MNDNECRVLDLILKNTKMSQVDIAKNIGISKAAISKIVGKLKTQKFISEIYVDEVKLKGRPKQYLVINNLDMKVIGINFGKDYFEISLGNIAGEILKSKTKKFFMKKNMSIVNILIKELDEFLNETAGFKILGIGIILNGVVDYSKKLILNHLYYKWENLNLSEIIEKRYSIPVIIDNNVRTMLRTEIQFSQLKNLKDIFYIYIKDGISSSIMINNEILIGENNNSGQISHYIPAKNDNKLCECNKRGCVNSMYSESSIILKIQEEYEKNNEKLEINSLYELYKKTCSEEKLAGKIIYEISVEIGNIVGNILNVLDIKNIIVAGDIVFSENIFKNGFNKGISENFRNNKLDIYYSKLGKNIEKKSALNLVIENIFSNLKLIKLL